MCLVLNGHIREPLWLHCFKRKLPRKGGSPFGVRTLKDAILVFETLASAALHRKAPINTDRSQQGISPLQSVR